MLPTLTPLVFCMVNYTMVGHAFMVDTDSVKSAKALPGKQKYTLCKYMHAHKWTYAYGHTSICLHMYTCTHAYDSLDRETIQCTCLKPLIEVHYPKISFHYFHLSFHQSSSLTGFFHLHFSVLPFSSEWIICLNQWSLPYTLQFLLYPIFFHFHWIRYSTHFSVCSRPKC